MDIKKTMKIMMTTLMASLSGALVAAGAFLSLWLLIPAMLCALAALSGCRKKENS